MDQLREMEIDWANWLCTGNNALRLSLRKMDPDYAREVFRDAWFAGRCRSSQEAIRVLEHCQELVG